MDIILHLGAHKTASTYLQKKLARSQGRLRRSQVSFHGPKSLRPRINLALGKSKGMPEAEIQARRTACINRLISEEEAIGTERLILSEEQFLGPLRDMVLGRDFYHDAESHLAPIARALDGRRVQILLSVRGYAKFLASVYGQVVRGWRFIPFDQKIRSRLLNQNNGWPEVVERVMNQFPRASRIVIWRYEDFPRIEHEVLENLAGPAAGLLKPLAERPFAAMSQTAIDWLHDQAASGNPPDRQTVQSVYDTIGRQAGHPAFDPWSEDERSYLDARYRQDLIWLYRLTECEWIAAPETIAA
ncbi:MAG: hypothetical protein AAF557_06000 [Pseudomonadota bacterium]